MISRDPLDLAGQAIGAEPSISRRTGALPRHDVRADQDRLGPGQGFTHVIGDIVTVATRSSARSSPASTNRTGFPLELGAGA